MADFENLYMEFFLLYHRMVRQLDRRMAEQGASLARTRLMMCLQKTDLKRAAEIAEFFNLAPRTITEAIDGLEREGLVERRPDPEDRRAKHIILTPAGERAIQRTEPLRLAMIEQTFGMLDSDERERMLAYLMKIGSTLDAPAAGLSGDRDEHASGEKVARIADV